jgi:hypothetical protein
MIEPTQPRALAHARTLVLLGGVLLGACADPGGFRTDGAVAPSPDGGVQPPRDAGPPPDAGPQPDSGTPGVTFTERTIDDAIVHGQSIDLVDIDDDGDLDVLLAISLTDAVHLYRNEGRGERWTRVEIARRGTIVAMDTVAADFDGDGDLDVAAIGLFGRAGGFGTPGEVAWYENPGRPDAAWTARPVTGRAFWAPRSLASADLTGDGVHDLVIGTLEANGPEPTAGVSWIRRQADGWSAPQRIDPDLRAATTVLTHDVDGNGVPDVVAVGTNSGEVVWYENLRAPGTEADAPAFTRHVIASPQEPHDVRLAQLDDDPDLELLVTVARGAGAVVGYDPPADPRAPWVERELVPDFGGSDRVRALAADLDGDGRTDLAVSSFPASELRVYLAGADGFVAQTVFSGYPGLNGFASGDLDGDGRVDLLTSTYELESGRDVLAWWSNRP